MTDTYTRDKAALDTVPWPVLRQVVAADPTFFSLFASCQGGDRPVISYETDTFDLVGMELDPLEFPTCDGFQEDLRRLGCDMPIFDEVPDGVVVDAAAFCDEVAKVLHERLNPKDGTFTLHWKNGDPMVPGQGFRAYVDGEGLSEVKTVDSVDLHVFKDGRSDAWVYCGNAGYRLSMCEPVRDPTNPRDVTTHNVASVAGKRFKCLRCGAEFGQPDLTYCPKCGRRVL